MQLKTVDLYKYTGMNRPEGGTGYLSCYLQRPSSAGRPAVLIIPGGGYEHVSVREGEPVALRFLAQGYHAFVLEYSVEAAACDKHPLEELARTVLMVRQNAEKWLVDPQKVVVIGFSAGGHLAASLGVHWDDPEILARCGVSDAKLLQIVRAHV